MSPSSDPDDQVIRFVFGLSVEVNGREYIGNGKVARD